VVNLNQRIENIVKVGENYEGIHKVSVAKLHVVNVNQSIETLVMVGEDDKEIHKASVAKLHLVKLESKHWDFGQGCRR
jgi:hypothetical protein